LDVLAKAQDARAWMEANPNANAIELQERYADLERSMYRR